MNEVASLGNAIGSAMGAISWLYSIVSGFAGYDPITSRERELESYGRRIEFHTALVEQMNTQIDVMTEMLERDRDKLGAEYIEVQKREIVMLTRMRERHLRKIETFKINAEALAKDIGAMRQAKLDAEKAKVNPEIADRDQRIADLENDYTRAADLVERQRIDLTEQTAKLKETVEANAALEEKNAKLTKNVERLKLLLSSTYGTIGNAKKIARARTRRPTAKKQKRTRR